MAALSTVLLDAGGVLLDETAHEAAWRQVACELLDITAEQYDAEVADAVRTFVPRVYQFVFWNHTRPDAGRFDRFPEGQQLAPQRRFRRMWSTESSNRRAMPMCSPSTRRRAKHL